ncbi:MAG: VCBS repeat-containing protein, partial [Myxococcota bacterium]
MLTIWTLALPANATDPSFGLGVGGTYDFGIAVTGGDFDGDGLSDLAAAGRTLASGWEEPIVHVYDGATTAPGTSTSPSVSLAFEDVWWDPALAAADVNGDGFDDLLVGIGRSFVECCGYVDVYLGSNAGLPSTRSARLEGFAFADYFGTSVASAGDVDGDGFDDVVIGAEYGDPSGASTGAAHLFLGSATGLVEPPLRSWYGARNFDHLGEFVSGGGDVDGDGYDDVLVSAPDALDGRGQVQWYPGSPSGPADAPSAVLAGTNATSRIVGSIVGDVDGDGFADLVLRFQDASGPGGIVYGRGGPTGPAIDRVLAFPDPTGAVPHPAGDVNGDGFADFLVSSRWIDVAQIWLGGPSGPGWIPARALGGGSSEEWGCC